MKKHPLSTGCAYVMLIALIVFGLAGLAIKYAAILPAAWSPVTDQAQTAIIVSLAAAFVAAAVASMRSAWHAERAHQAGRAYAHVMWLAIGYTAVCIVIEVAIGKLGASMIGMDIPVLALTALLVFFAVAPRIVAVILSGLDGLARSEAKADDQVEHERDLDRQRLNIEALDKRIQAGNDARIADLALARDARKTGSVHGGIALVGAAAALLGASGDPAEARVEYPTESATVSTISAKASEVPAMLMAQGPQHAAAYDRMTRILKESPSISNRRLGRAISVHHATAKKWRAHYRAQQALAYAQNGGLLEAAA